MAAGYLAEPGTEFGPCQEPCSHRDCAASRKTASSICRYCDTPIGWDVRFYRDDDGFTHEICELEQIEREQKVASSTVPKWFHVSLENDRREWIGNGLIKATDEQDAVICAANHGYHHSRTSSVYEVDYEYAAKVAVVILS